MQLNFSPFPSLNTNRLLLRQLQISDGAEIFALRSNPENAVYLDRPLAKDLEEALDFINQINTHISNNALIFWAIAPSKEKRVLGTICLWRIDPKNASAEIGYELHPDFQGQGYVQEAIPAVIQYGFKVMELEWINATVSPQNIKSIKLLEKFQFNLAGPGEESGTVLYQLKKF